MASVPLRLLWLSMKATQILFSEPHFRLTPFRKTCNHYQLLPWHRFLHATHLVTPTVPLSSFQFYFFSSYFLLFCPFLICATLIICTLTKADPTKRPLSDWPRRLRAVRVCASADPTHDLMFSEDALSDVERCLGFGLLKTDGKQRKFSAFVLFCVRAGPPALGTAHAR